MKVQELIRAIDKPMKLSQAAEYAEFDVVVSGDDPLVVKSFYVNAETRQLVLIASRVDDVCDRVPL